MKKSDQVVRQQVLQQFAAQLRQARKRASLSIPQLSRATRISEQHLRRMEGGENEPGLLRLLAISRATKTDVTWFLPAVATATVETYVDELWVHHHIGEKLPGAETLDVETKQKILASMGLWQPPPARGVHYQSVAVLPDRSALLDVLCHLPPTTKGLTMLGVSGAYTLTPVLLEHLEELLAKKASLEFLFLDPAGKEARKVPEDDRKALADELETSLVALSGMVERVAMQDPTVSRRVSVKLYDQPPIWHIVEVGGDTLYVSNAHMVEAPVWRIEGTLAETSAFYASMHVAFTMECDKYRRGARDIALPYVPHDRQARSLARRTRPRTRSRGR